MSTETFYWNYGSKGDDKNAKNNEYEQEEQKLIMLKMNLNVNTKNNKQMTGNRNVFIWVMYSQMFTSKQLRAFSEVFFTLLLALDFWGKEMYYFVKRIASIVSPINSKTSALL